MKIYSVNDPEFKPYGRVVTGLEAAKPRYWPRWQPPRCPPQRIMLQRTSACRSCPPPWRCRSICSAACPASCWCNGHNTYLNCLEYHRDSEFNLGTEDFVLLLARMEDIEDGKLDTAKVKAFRAPAGTLVEVYATTLHYAPCHVDADKGFRVLVALPKGTNTAKPDIQNNGGDDPLLWACNKWLLAHAESTEAKAGAYVGLVGENIHI